MTGEDLEADSADEQSLYGNAFLAEQAACEPGDEDDDALLGTSGVAGDLARSHEVAEGETLRDISQVWFGSPDLWDRIFQANHSLLDGNPEKLKPGIWLQIPPKDLAPAVQPAIVEEMEYANRKDETHPGPDYPGWEGDELVGHHDPAYWEDIGGSEWIVELKKGKSAYDAVSSLLNDANTKTDCATMLHAVQASAVARTVGKDVFDRNFGAEGEDNQDLVLGGAGSDRRLQSVFQNVEAAGVADLEPGDQVFFRNTEKYSRKHPMGFWKGLNAIYMGNGKFSGFRIPAASVEEIVDNLADAYNLHPSETGSEAADGYDPALEKDQITIQDVPGIELDDVDRANESALQALYQ